MKNGRFKYLAIPLLFTLVIGTLLIVSIPVDFNKYRLEVKLGHLGAPHETYSFADINGDGIEDLVDCGGLNKDGERNNSCRVYSLLNGSERYTLDQINVNELIYDDQQLLVTNFDGDAYDELLILSAEGNELYLLAFEAPNLETAFCKTFVDSVPRENGKLTPILKYIGSQDINNDGFKEIYFYLGSGFAHYPRRSYRLDLKKGQIIRSVRSSCGFGATPHEITDFSVFSGNCQNPGNYEDSLQLPYPDLYGYSYAFDQNLEFLFEPQPVVAYPGNAQNVILNGYLFTLWHTETAQGKTHLEKRQLPDGRKLDSKTFDFAKASIKKVDTELVVSTSGLLLRLDDHLRIVEQIEHKLLSHMVSWRDLNRDNQPELISSPYASGKVAIFSSSYDHPVTFSRESTSNYLIRVRKVKENAAHLVVRQDDSLTFYEYIENSLYWLRWPYYLGIFIIAGLGSSFLFKRFRKNIEAKYEQERQLNQFQLLSIKNQVDPHFTLNALNSIDWMYRNNEPRKASRFMGKLSRLMHQTVLNSNKISSSLWEELDFCRNYCELERLRDQSFSYQIHIDEALDPFEVEVPKQLVFIHVENAIKHGLRPKAGKRRLFIEAHRLSDHLKIIVEDNGVGFQRNGTSSGTGKGLLIHQEVSALFKKIKARQITFKPLPNRFGGTTVVLRMELERTPPRPGFFS